MTLIGELPDPDWPATLATITQHASEQLGPIRAAAVTTLGAIYVVPENDPDHVYQLRHGPRSPHPFRYEKTDLTWETVLTNTTQDRHT